MVDANDGDQHAPSGQTVTMIVDLDKIDRTSTVPDPSGSGLPCYGNFGLPPLGLTGAPHWTTIRFDLSGEGAAQTKILDFRYCGWDVNSGEPLPGSTWERGWHAPTYVNGGGAQDPGWPADNHGAGFKYLRGFWKNPFADMPGRLTVRDYEGGGPGYTNRYVLELQLPDGTRCVVDPEIKNQEE